MKPLLMSALLLCPAPPAAGEAWWNKEWKFRRPLVIHNRLDRPLENGFTLQVEVDADYLGIREKSKTAFEDWVLVRSGVRVPCLLQPGRGKAPLLCFRTAADIAPGASDGYFLYYGAPEASAAPVPPGQIYEYFEDFSRPEALADRFEIDKDLTASISNGGLVIQDVATGRFASSPARIALRKFPALAGFELSFDLEMDSSDAAAAGFAVMVELKEPGSSDPSIGKKIDELIEKLGDDSWENREGATKALIALGRLAAARLVDAARSADAEVKWRAAHVIKMIQEHSPAPVISAGVTGGEPGAPAWLTSVIGKNRARMRTAGWPVKAHIVVQRDPDGEIKVMWNGRYPQSGIMPGAIQQVAFAFHKAGAVPLGTIRINNLIVRRSVDEDSRPTSTIDLEETRP